MNRYIDPVALDLAAKRLGVSSDEQLGEKLRINPQTIRNLRHRRCSPSLASLVKIAEAAGVSWESATITATPNHAAA